MEYKLKDVWQLKNSLQLPNNQIDQTVDVQISYVDDLGEEIKIDYINIVVSELGVMGTTTDGEIHSFYSPDNQDSKWNESYYTTWNFSGGDKTIQSVAKEFYQFMLENAEYAPISATVEYNGSYLTELEPDTEVTLECEGQNMTSNLVIQTFSQLGGSSGGGSIKGIWTGNDNGALEYNTRESIANGENSNAFSGAKTLSNYSNAFGGESVAGGKCFTISRYSRNSDGTGFFEIEGATPQNTWIDKYYCGKIGNVSIVNGAGLLDIGPGQQRTGKITGVAGDGCTIFVNGLPDSLNSPLDENDDRYFFVVGLPEEGTDSIGDHSFAHGEGCIAQERASAAFGRGSHVVGAYGFAEGRQTMAGYAAHGEGYRSIALGGSSHAEGHQTKALGFHAHAEGQRTLADGEDSHVEGTLSKANGIASHAEGNNTLANGDYSHSEGRDTKSFGKDSHAEGFASEASGQASHSEGELAKALGDYSHAEGKGCIARGYNSHAQGCHTQANGDYSHAEGYGCVADGYVSHAQGCYTQTSANRSYQHVIGVYNKVLDDKLFIIGHGTGEASRRNIFSVDIDGNIHMLGNGIYMNGDNGKQYRLYIDGNGNVKAELTTHEI